MTCEAGECSSVSHFKQFTSPETNRGANRVLSAVDCTARTITVRIPQMSSSSYLPPSLIRVEKISLSGPGVVILTGPSSCGKGEVASALCELLSIDTARHLSMGSILRTTVDRAKTDKTFASMLADKYSLSRDVSIFDCKDSTDELSEKVRRYQPKLQEFFNTERSADNDDVSQLEWLEFCTVHGLLIPNRWTQDLISAAVDSIVLPGTKDHDHPIILDGYPRTEAAAEHLLGYLSSVNVPVLKVLHLSISKAEMSLRAGKRGRADDHAEALRSRFEFYVENVQPSVDYIKQELGGSAVSLIDAHQPAHVDTPDGRKFHLQNSIDNVVSTALRAMGVPRVIVRDLIEARREKNA